MFARRRPLWRHRDFMRLWAAQAVSAFGSRITRTALPIIAILLVSASPMELSVLGALDVVPGVLDAERLRPRGVIWCLAPNDTSPPRAIA